VPAIALWKLVLLRSAWLLDSSRAWRGGWILLVVAWWFGFVVSMGLGDFGILLGFAIAVLCLWFGSWKEKLGREREGVYM